MSDSQPILELDDVTIQYRTSGGMLTAVSDASFTIGQGEYFGLVGESGCGKSTIAKTLIGALDDNGEIASGEIRYKGDPIEHYTENQFNKELRWKEISMIPQGSMNNLDPIEKISDQAIEIAQVHTDMTKSEALERFKELFEVVGIQQSRIHDYPHQFSGGMEQRAIIALALFLRPSLIIADEPTTALDVIMQDQVFKYLDEIREEGNASMVLITHDISLVFESCDDIAIMHSGQVAETGDIETIYDNPRHPYSFMLQGAFPDHRYPDRDLEIIEGYPPENMGDVSYCTFVDRCPYAVDECREMAPELEQWEQAESNHLVSCFRSEDAYEEHQRQKEMSDNEAESGADGESTEVHGDD